jgi:hypothetical protein
MFDYSNMQTKQHGGRKTVRHVKIKDGKGYKKVVYYKNGRKIGTAKKPLHSTEISMSSGGALASASEFLWVTVRELASVSGREEGVEGGAIG